MAAQPGNQQQNFWQNYRNEPIMSAAEVQAFYRQHDYVEFTPNQLRGPDTRYINLGPGSPLVRPSARDNNPIHRQFLDKVMPQLMSNPAERQFWEGTKFLGEGPDAMVVLWEYNHPDRNAPVPAVGRKVAVKELKDGVARGRDLSREGRSYMKLREAGSNHIVGLLADPQEIVAVDEGLDPEWDGAVRRLILEYCSLGSMFDLVQRRNRL